jgi:hypothetical protein
MNNFRRPSDAQIEKFLDEAYADGGTGIYGIFAVKRDPLTGRDVLQRIGRSTTHYGAVQFQMQKYSKYGDTAVAYFSDYSMDDVPARIGHTDKRILN